MKRIKKILNYLKWLDQERIKAAIYTGNPGPLI
jgi:hypothetical protein